MVMWVAMLIAVVILLVAGVVLNISAIGIVKDSQIHTSEQKQLYTRVIWAVPIFGVIYVMLAIRRDIAKSQAKVKDEIVSALKSINDNLDNLEAGLRNKIDDKTLH
ncbi:MAG: hypothetical protein OEZ68_14060 [Gammaproteobacteria bacterium]|nr:hypothetical protein [Gammaproteobacteria bacterium]MDH5801927.1 hypothetical protein [Gammaproteobacteria bacterium]